MSNMNYMDEYMISLKKGKYIANVTSVFTDHLDQFGVSLKIITPLCSFNQFIF